MEIQGSRIVNNTISLSQNKRNLFLFNIDAVLINAAYVLTTGVFISGYIIYLNGSDILLALLKDSVAWTHIICLSTIFIFEKIVNRKRFLILLNLLSRLLVCSIVVLPMIFDNKEILLCVAACFIIISNILWSIYNIGWTVWYLEGLTDHSRSSYIYKRNLLIRISVTVVTIGMGFVLDSLNKSYTGFLIVFCTSFLLSVIDICILLFIQDKPKKKETELNTTSVKAFFEPLVNERFRKYLLFILLFYISITISSTFTALYLLKYLSFNYSLISISTAVTYILMIVFNQLWGRIERSKGAKFVLVVSGFIAIGELLAYFFLNRNTYYLLFIAAVLSGIGNSGFGISLLNYRYDIIGNNNRVAYESWYKVVYGISVLFAPFIGSIFMGIISALDSSITQAGKIQILYLISFAITGFVIYLSFCNNSKTSGKRSEDTGTDTRQEAKI